MLHVHDAAGDGPFSVSSNVASGLTEGRHAPIASGALMTMNANVAQSNNHQPILLDNGAQAFIHDDQIEVVTTRPGRAITGRIKAPGVTRRVVAKPASQSTRVHVQMVEAATNNNVCMPEVVNLVSEDPLDILPVLSEMETKSKRAQGTIRRPLKRIQVTRRSSINNNHARGNCHL